MNMPCWSQCVSYLTVSSVRRPPPPWTPTVGAASLSPGTSAGAGAGGSGVGQHSSLLPLSRGIPRFRLGDGRRLCPPRGRRKVLCAWPPTCRGGGRARSRPSARDECGLSARASRAPCPAREEGAAGPPGSAGRGLGLWE